MDLQSSVETVSIVIETLLKNSRSRATVTTDFVVVDFLYCLYAQSLHHGGIECRK